MAEQTDGTSRAGLEGGFDLRRTVRERPLASVGVVLGAGLLLGLLTGGGQEAERVDARVGGGSDLWERRARRLLRLAHEQREELDRLRAIRWGGEGDELDEVDEDEDYDDEPEDEGAAGGLAELLRDGLQRLMRTALRND